MLPEDVTVPIAMSTWENQGGFPVVVVERDYERGSAIFGQERFLLVGEDSDSTKWVIPINYASASNFDFSDSRATNWIPTSSEIYLNLGLKREDWFLVNKQAAGKNTDSNSFRNLY